MDITTCPEEERIFDSTTNNESGIHTAIREREIDLLPYIVSIKRDFLIFLTRLNSRKGGIKEANYFIQNVFQRYFWMCEFCKVLCDNERDINMTKKRIFQEIENEAKSKIKTTKLLAVWDLIQQKIQENNKQKECLKNFVDIITRQDSKCFMDVNLEKLYSKKDSKDQLVKSDPQKTQQNWIQNIQSKICALMCYLRLKYGRDNGFLDISDIWEKIYGNQLNKNKKRDRVANYGNSISEQEDSPAILNQNNQYQQQSNHNDENQLSLDEQQQNSSLEVGEEIYLSQEDNEPINNRQIEQMIPNQAEGYCLPFQEENNDFFNDFSQHIYYQPNLIQNSINAYDISGNGTAGSNDDDDDHYHHQNSISL